MATTLFTSMGNSADSRRLVQRRDTVYLGDETISFVCLTTKRSSPPPEPGMTKGTGTGGSAAAPGSATPPWTALIAAPLVAVARMTWAPPSVRSSAAGSWASLSM